MDDKGHTKIKTKGIGKGEREFDGLVQLARESGANEVGIMRASEVPVEDGLATLCGDPPCDAYGLSGNCPPHVSGPDGFRELKKKMRHALVFRIDIPESVMFSNDRNEVFGLVQETVAELERAAVHMGSPESKGFAGGSCKNIFCYDHGACRVLSKEGECRNPERARPSMSGFGINVMELLKKAGIPPGNAVTQPEDLKEPMTWVAGLVMLG